MLNLYETLQAVISDCDITNCKSDASVIHYLKCVLCLKTDDKSYAYFMDYAEQISVYVSETNHCDVLDWTELQIDMGGV